MKELLVINNFAGLKDISIELGNINVLIGPQATGKSIIAKCLFYFKSFLTDLFNAAEVDKPKRDFDIEYKRKFEEYFPTTIVHDQDFTIRYEINNTFIQIEKNKSIIKLDYSEYYKKELRSLKLQIANSIDKYKSKKRSNDHGETFDVSFDRFRIIYQIRHDFFAKQFIKLGRNSGFYQFFIPAGRSFFSILQSSIFSFLSSNKAIDPFLTEFGSLYENMKSMNQHRYMNTDSEKVLRSKIDPLIEYILNGKHENIKGKDYLNLNDGRKISLENASSGQQEMLPLALILRNISRPFSNGSGNTVYIEEPEAHLFPDSQRQIVNLIATIFNMSSTPVQFIITTHSPYILSSLNNLIYARSVESKLSPTSAKRKKLNKAIPEEQRISYNETEVYAIKNGEVQSIKSDEMELIKTNILDNASDIITSQFDQILDLDE